MWNIKHTCHKDKGFTLIEVILALAILSMVILPLFSILNFSLKSCKVGEERDELMLNGRYAIEFIKGEIKWADKIISLNKIEDIKEKYPANIGFVIMSKIMDEKNADENKVLGYRYITYYTKDKKLFRISWNLTRERYPSTMDLRGNNGICELVDNIQDTKFIPEHSLISLAFNFKNESGESLNLNTDIYIRCPVDY